MMQSDISMHSVMFIVLQVSNIHFFETILNIWIFIC